MLPFPVEYYAATKPAWQTGLERLIVAAWSLLLSGLILWAAGAFWYDFPVPKLRMVAAGCYLLMVLVPVILVRPAFRSPVVLGMFALVLGWWLTIKPSNDRAWQPDVDRTASAEIKDGSVILHNVRNFDYRTATDFTPQWETRTYDLSRLSGVDLFFNYRGSKFMAHPIISFHFADDERVCISIEKRKTLGQKDSFIGGIYRQYELVYIVGDERDLVRLRTDIRKEEMYLYHLKMTNEQARTVFLEYIARINALHTKPEFFNALTSNCTTSIRSQSATSRRWDWRIFLNGYADKMMYDHGDLDGNLEFAELKKRACINRAILDNKPADDFSRLIREGRPGF